MKIPGEKELTVSAIGKNRKTNGNIPFILTKIFIFACILRVLTGASYRQLEKFLGV